MNNTKKNISIWNKKRWFIFGLMLLLVIYWNVLPHTLFQTSYSTVLEDVNGKLLGATIADDDQWRFPISNEVPEKFKIALLQFEDRDFEEHIGIDFSSLIRATKQNLEARKVVSGASTITMQVIRLAQKNPPRTIPQKIKEMILATRLELSLSKDEILSLYAGHAPFGGNVVGLEAASWRYFGRNADELSWAESAMLAVLPNSPALIHPGRNRDELKTKRDRLLNRLHEQDVIDELTLELALLEELPNKPLALPQFAPHYLAKLLSSQQKGTRIRSGIEQSLQLKVSNIVDFHHQQLSQNGIENTAILVLDVKQQRVLSYVGNTHSGDLNDQHVNIIDAPRSTGSILKPLLYMLLLDEGAILPNTLVADVPTKFSDYSPENFSRSYDGAVPASQMVARSLNVPAVHLLKEYGVPKFQHKLKEFGITSIQKPPEHYGLTLILGGAEASLWEITSLYASQAHQMNSYDARRPETNTYSFIDFEGKSTNPKSVTLNAGSIWTMLETMVDVQRPEDEVFWRRFDGARKVAWKTGTSFGNRDGWAIGITPDYVVGVWVGNADGEGRPELTGVTSAGPILFDVFNALPSTTWFQEPIYELEKISICAKSGHRVGAYCKTIKKEWVPKKGLNTTVCPYHNPYHLDQHRNFQVNTKCAEKSAMIAESRFVLPPDQAFYYRKAHPSYQPLPPFHPKCTNNTFSSMKFIYPFSNSSIYVPVELDGDTGKTVFEIAHVNPSTKIFWHLNEQYLGETKNFHQLSVSPKAGKYNLVLIDEYGSRIEQAIEIIGK